MFKILLDLFNQLDFFLNQKPKNPIFSQQIFIFSSIVSLDLDPIFFFISQQQKIQKTKYEEEKNKIMGRIPIPKPKSLYFLKPHTLHKPPLRSPGSSRSFPLSFPLSVIFLSLVCSLPKSCRLLCKPQQAVETLPMYSAFCLFF